MSKRIVAGITMALMAALAGCQAPSGTAPQSQMLMRQLPKASKVATAKAEPGALNMVIRGNFARKRSLLYVAADIDRLEVIVTGPNNFSQTRQLVRDTDWFANELGTSTEVQSQFTPLQPGEYSVQVNAYEANDNMIGGGTSGAVTVTSGGTTNAAVAINLGASAPGTLNAVITINDYTGP